MNLLLLVRYRALLDRRYNLVLDDALTEEAEDEIHDEMEALWGQLTEEEAANAQAYSDRWDAVVLREKQRRKTEKRVGACLAGALIGGLLLGGVFGDVGATVGLALGGLLGLLSAARSQES